MRIFPLSDLHLERRRLDLIEPPSGDFDVLACAGDLYEGHPERGLAALLHLAQGRPVVLVPGNHEHYAPTGYPRNAPQLLAALVAEVDRLNGLGAGIRLLQGGGSTVIDGVRFVGTTLWSDWTLAGRWLRDDTPDRPSDPIAYAAARMTDQVTGSREYRGSIRKEDGTHWQPADAMAAHLAERDTLCAALAIPHAGPTVAITHHPASPLAADRYREDRGGSLDCFTPFAMTGLVRKNVVGSRPPLPRKTGRGECSPAYRCTSTLRNCQGSLVSISSGNRPGRSVSGVQSV